MKDPGLKEPGMSAPHIPVLLDEVLAALDPQPGSVIVDATFGAGGYTRSLLDAGATVHAFDRDPDAIAAGRTWPETGAKTGPETGPGTGPGTGAKTGSGTGPTPPRLVLHPRRFSEMVAALAEAGVAQVDGIALDIGMSSMQLDQAARGFAFSADGPLDMRMSQDGQSAADFLNTAQESTIADVLYRYGEERQSRRVARAIVAARPLVTTGDLARVVRKALGFRPGAAAGAHKDPATRSFQAIRIHVNAELEELEAALIAAEQLLREGGKMALVTFHSLEDRIVKHFLRDASGGRGSGSRHLPVANDTVAASFCAVAKPIRPSAAECARNPRARSATLRAATRTAAPARQEAA